MCDFVIYGDVIGLNVYNKPGLDKIQEKIEEMLLSIPAGAEQEDFISAEIIMDPEDKSCTLAVYACTEKDGVQILECDISRDPALYTEFREYALKAFREKLLPG